MDDKLKLKLFDQFLDMISIHQKTESVFVPRQIGTLNKIIGQNGFKKAEPKTPVFDLGDRYMIMMESLDGKRNVEVTYYKETLKDAINFGDSL
jgi:hypothetical protein